MKRNLVKKFIWRSFRRYFSHLVPHFKRFLDQIECLLTEKGFEYVLTRRKNNFQTEYRFSVSTHLVGNHLVLDSSAFSHNERALSLRLIIKLYANQDGSRKIMSCKIFFKEIQSII